MQKHIQVCDLLELERFISIIKTLPEIIIGRNITWKQLYYQEGLVPGLDL